MSRPIDAELQGRLIDHVLGEASDAERAVLREELERDVEVAVARGELAVLFDRMRSVTVAPSGRVAQAVRAAIARRRREHGVLPFSRRVLRAVAVAAVAAAALCCALLVERGLRLARAPHAGVPAVAHLEAVRVPAARDTQLDTLLARDHLPVRDPSFAACVARFAHATPPATLSGWLDASDELVELRELLRTRYEPDRRRAVLAAIGARDLDGRLDPLAATVAAQVEAQVADGDAAVDDLSLALRALLVAGSSRRTGPNRAAVDACADELVGRLPRLDEGEVASVLAALAELAVLEGGALVEAVGLYAEALATSTLTGRGDARPGLLAWHTPAARLADAGRMLRIAPAFGVHAGVAFRARVMIAAHLEERIRRDGGDQPALLAAQLYGFGDLVDRTAVEIALQRWNLRTVLPDFAALHHLAWSRIPTRPGWASFQQELRGLASVATPAATRDAACLLLSLAASYSSS